MVLGEVLSAGIDAATCVARWTIRGVRMLMNAVCSHLWVGGIMDDCEQDRKGVGQKQSCGASRRVLDFWLSFRLNCCRVAVWRISYISSCDFGTRVLTSEKHATLSSFAINNDETISLQVRHLSTMLPPTKNRPANRGDVSLSSTVGAPTPARYATQAYRAREVGNVSLASTTAPNKPGRPPRSALTTPAMRALADTSTYAYASSSAAPRPRGRPPKSILSTPGSRTLTSPGNASVSFSDQSRPRGRPPRFRATDIDTSASKPPPAKKRGRSSKASLAAASADASASTSMGPPAQKPRSRPPASAAKTKSKPALGLPQSATRHSRPVEEDEDSASDVSLVDGVSDEDSDASEVQSEEDEEAGMSSDDPDATVPGTRRLKAKNRKGWPSERERLRKWRRLSVEERECVTSEGGLIWRTAM